MRLIDNICQPIFEYKKKGIVIRHIWESPLVLLATPYQLVFDGLV